ncbi:hypothetical protein EGW08_011265 [Elysia chlorotica]|uniref:G-protein coupled receptors family 1 profile domain-containing protein n=1 Tax=Elysia chlorotica TaxID=188477 RepID=A0A3S0ZRE2_ELYCH|nr:hypothetical protein EGW08_011265 [Elysia chlorotica]
MDDRENESFVGNDTCTTDLTAHHRAIWILEILARQICFPLLFDWINFCVSIIGVVGNILIIAVYSKLGFFESIHISYVALAAVDLCSFFPGLAQTLLRKVFLPLANIHVQDNFQFGAVFMAWPYTAFSRTSGLVTAWVSLERCLCVACPMAVKTLITRRATVAAITAILTLGCAPLLSAFLGVSFHWDFNLGNNGTLVILTKNGSNKLLVLLKMIAGVLLGALYPALSWITVSVCTTVLVVKLKQSARWRQRNACPRNTVNTVRGREATMSTQRLRVTKTVVIVASLFIALSLPLSVHLLLTIAMKETYRVDGTYPYIFQVMSFITLTLNHVNSSANIFVFTAMGSKFRNTLKNILHFKCS